MPRTVKGRIWKTIIIIVGVDSGEMVYTSTDALFDEHTYPTTTGELIESYGQEELQLADGSQTVEDVLSVLGQETFESAEEARYAVYTGLSSAAIGRVGYSDRDPTPPGCDGQPPVSF